MFGPFYMLFTNETDCARWGKKVFSTQAFQNDTFYGCNGNNHGTMILLLQAITPSRNGTRLELHISVLIRPSLIE